MQALDTVILLDSLVDHAQNVFASLWIAKEDGREAFQIIS